MPNAVFDWDVWFAWRPVRLHPASGRTAGRVAFLRKVERFRCVDRTDAKTTAYFPIGYDRASFKGS